MTVPTGPPGWTPSACPGLFCPPGSKSVTVTISDCATGKQIGVLTPFILSDATGSTATSVNGVALICCGIAGYSFTIGYQGYEGKQYTLTPADMLAQSAHVCLTQSPPPPPHNSCTVSSLMRTDGFEPTAQALAPFYRVRDTLASTPRGGELVTLYYDPDTKERIDRAVQNSPELRAEGLSLILELLPALARAQRSGLPGAGTGHCDCDQGGLLSEDVQRRGARFLNALEAGSEASELIGMVRELAQAAQQGLRAIEHWLTDAPGEGKDIGEHD